MHLPTALPRKDGDVNVRDAEGAVCFGKSSLMKVIEGCRKIRKQATGKIVLWKLQRRDKVEAINWIRMETTKISDHFVKTQDRGLCSRAWSLSVVAKSVARTIFRGMTPGGEVGGHHFFGRLATTHQTHT
jgi:hypothetical protein